MDTHSHTVNSTNTMEQVTQHDKTTGDGELGTAPWNETVHK